MSTLYDITATDAEGIEVSLADYRGKVLLIVNTATGCGFTPQYAGLQALYEKYADQGFEILDFPCNQFGNQAPGADDEIVDFCQSKFGTTFKTFSKIDVNGPDAHPLFVWLKSQKGGIMGSDIKWNFTKFLVDRQGNVVARSGSTTTPEKIDAKVRSLL